MFYKCQNTKRNLHFYVSQFASKLFFPKVCIFLISSDLFGVDGPVQIKMKKMYT